MPIRIDSISAQGLGPISKFDFAFKDVSLIFGENERGKTCVVEFLLNSLFKNSNLRTRNLGGNGQVVISGIAKAPKSFNPTSKNKLEECFINEMLGAPLDFSRLCVVKGAELSLDLKVNGGVNKKIVQDYLSDQRTLDLIQKKILPTIQNAQLIEGEITGASQGNLKKRNELKNQIKNTNVLFEKINELYSDTDCLGLLEEKAKIEQEIKDKEKAKRSLAGSISKEINAIQEECEKTPDEVIKSIAAKVRRFLDLGVTINTKKEECERRSKNSENYPWLKTAVQIYQIDSTQKIAQPHSALAIVGGIAFLGSIASTFFRNPVLAVVFIMLGVTLLSIYIALLLKRQRNITKNLEVEKIEKEYKQFFGKPCTNLATLMATEEQLRADYITSQNLLNEISELESNNSALEREIKNHFSNLSYKTVDKKNFEYQLDLVSHKLKQSEQQLNQKQIDLASLNVPPAEYLFDGKRDHSFVQSRLDELNRDLNKISQELAEKENQLTDLKAEICRFTNTPISTPWEEILQALREYLDLKLLECRGITAGILGGIVLNQVIGNARETQDEDLRRSLTDQIVLKPLRTITHKYTGLDIEDNELIITNDIIRYPLSQVSTGTQEQVLLALRIGFISKILKGDTFFLILDDAFQHSDWNRREWLLDEVFDLAKSGWQIIYFSMDNHIRDLFQAKAAKNKKIEFAYAEIK
jgi:hypothetical protein